VQARVDRVREVPAVGVHVLAAKGARGGGGRGGQCDGRVAGWGTSQVGAGCGDAALRGGTMDAGGAGAAGDRGTVTPPTPQCRPHAIAAAPVSCTHQASGSALAPAGHVVRIAGAARSCGCERGCGEAPGAPKHVENIPRVVWKPESVEQTPAARGLRAGQAGHSTGEERLGRTGSGEGSPQCGRRKTCRTSQGR